MTTEENRDISNGHKVSSSRGSILPVEDHVLFEHLSESHCQSDQVEENVSHHANTQTLVKHV